MIKQFTVGCSKTINLGNFQSMRIEAAVTWELLDGEDFEYSKGRAQEELSKLLEDTWRAQRKSGEHQ